MSDSECMHVSVIMAGGVGERFWPLSRQSRPKQLLAFGKSDKSMLQEVVEHGVALAGVDNTYVITGANLAAPIRDAGLPVPDENILVEPCKRNTTGAMAYMTAHLMATYPDMAPERISMAVLTVDYRADDTDAFLRTARVAMKVAETQQALVVYGMAPTWPATGLGYVEVAPESRQELGAPVFKVRAFHEKPDAPRAAAFVAAKNYYWNSGLFFWRISAFLEALSQVRPEMAAIITNMKDAMRSGDALNVRRHFEKLENISIDYALMEHAKNIWFVEGALQAPDVGAWTALRRADAVDGDNNYTEGEPVMLDCENCIVVNAPGAAKMAVAALGLSGVTVVVTEDAVLVMDSAREQEVRRIVEELRVRGAQQV